MNRALYLLMLLGGVCCGALAVRDQGTAQDIRSPDEIDKLIQKAAKRVQEEEARDDPVPPENEVVMAPGMKITATTKQGTVTIAAGKGLRRCYTWDGATRCVQMWPREERWYGSLGIYFPGSGDHWAEHKGVTRCVAEEGQQHFSTKPAALKWIEERKNSLYFGGRPAKLYVYRNDGLMVGWGITRERNQLNVAVWQIYINGEKPTELPGSDDRAVAIESKPP